MFEIIKDGDIIALTDSPYYIRQSSNGAYDAATEQNAQGVSVSGIPYNLSGRTPMPDLETVTVVPFGSDTVK